MVSNSIHAIYSAYQLKEKNYYSDKVSKAPARYMESSLMDASFKAFSAYSSRTS